MFATFVGSTCKKAMPNWRSNERIRSVVRVSRQVHERIDQTFQRPPVPRSHSWVLVFDFVGNLVVAPQNHIWVVVVIFGRWLPFSSWLRIRMKLTTSTKQVLVMLLVWNGETETYSKSEADAHPRTRCWVGCDTARDGTPRMDLSPTEHDVWHGVSKQLQLCPLQGDPTTARNHPKLLFCETWGNSMSQWLHDAKQDH